jgi:hypothetical protein
LGKGVLGVLVVGMLLQSLGVRRAEERLLQKFNKEELNQFSENVN